MTATTTKARKPAKRPQCATTSAALLAEMESDWCDSVARFSDTITDADWLDTSETVSDFDYRELL